MNIRLLQSLPIAAALVVLAASCGREKNFPSDAKMIVAVVGEGIPEARKVNSKESHLSPTNRAQGQAMWEGASAALARSPELAAYSSRIELLAYDDLGRETVAAQTAREIQKNPRVIAVIGHATSATTIAAAHLYREVGIPLLMPIATSPYATLQPGAELGTGRRLTNCFRLPPSDDLAQAPAVAALVLGRLKSKKCLVIGDHSEGAAAYSDPLYDHVVRLIDASHSVRLLQKVVDRDNTTFVDFARDIPMDPPDVIVFCGYGSTAIRLINALGPAYTAAPSAPLPRLVLTDGCLVPDLNTSGFDAFLTFPAPHIDQIPDMGSDTSVLKDLLRSQRQAYSYHVYGYDAMLLLARAIASAESRASLNRNGVRRALADMTNERGAFLGYTFKDGENTLARYYVFESPLVQGKKEDNDFHPYAVIESDELIHYSGAR